MTCNNLIIIKLRPHCANARQTDAMSLGLGELEETTGTPSYYVNEDYPARNEIQ